MSLSESSRITRSMRRAITEDSTGASGRQQDHLLSEMQRNEIITLLEDLLQAIKESISSLLKEEKMLNYLDSLKSTLLQKLQDQQLTINSLKEKNQRLESRVAILEHAIQAHERRRSDDEGETEEDLASKLEKDFKDLGLTLLETRLKEDNRIGPVITDVDNFGEETTRQQVIVKFKSWGDRTKVYRARKKSESYGYRVDLTRRRLNLLRKAREMAKGITAIEFTGFQIFDSEIEVANIIANL